MKFYILGFNDDKERSNFNSEIGEFISEHLENYCPVNSIGEFCSLINSIKDSNEKIIFHCLGHGSKKQDNTTHSGIDPVPWQVIADSFTSLRKRNNIVVVNLMSVCYSDYFKNYKDAYDIVWTVVEESPCLDIPTMIYTDIGYLDWTSYKMILDKQADYGYQEHVNK